MLAILNTFTVNINDKDVVQKLIGLVITENHLRVLAPTSTWLSEDAFSDIKCQYTQLMSNLVDVEQLSDREVRINYLDENTDTCELWTCLFETPESASSTLNAIEQSWSKLFGVPLTLTK